MHCEDKHVILFAKRHYKYEKGYHNLALSVVLSETYLLPLDGYSVLVYLVRHMETICRRYITGGQVDELNRRSLDLICGVVTAYNISEPRTYCRVENMNSILYTYIDLLAFVAIDEIPFDLGKPLPHIQNAIDEAIKAERLRTKNGGGV